MFGAGIGSLATEIAASRLLAPYFGSSTIVWANLIGIVLAGLAVGYWLGGRIADRRPEPRLLGLIVLAAAIWVALTPFVAGRSSTPRSGLDDASAGAVIGSFFAVLLLSRPPSCSGWSRRSRSGSRSPTSPRQAQAGRFYALSTAGSLLGTFVPALIAILLAGTQRTLLGTAALLALGLVPARPAGAGARSRAGRARRRAAGCGQGGAGPAARGGLALPVHPGGREAGRTPPAPSQRGRRRALGLAADTVLTGASGTPSGAAAAPRPAAPLGGDPRQRGGTTARALGVFYPQAHVDGVGSTRPSRVGREWFGMEDNLEPRRARRRRPPVPAAHGRALRPDRRRCLPPALRALLPRDARVLPARARAARAGRDRRAQRRLGPGDESLLDGIAGTLKHEFESVSVWPALRFNQDPAAPTNLAR